MYHKGNRDLQEHFGSTALADRLFEITHRFEFTVEDVTFIESCEYFFLATADSNGRPDCSFKGGPAGFVRVTGSDTLAFPDYDGNGMFKSLGNIRSNPNVGLLFIRMDGSPKRLRVNGVAHVDLEPGGHAPEGAQAMVHVTAQHIFPNCPRYIPDLGSGEKSRYIPASGERRVEPAWKSHAEFRDVVPDRKA